MATNRFINPRSQFFDSSGNIVSNGDLYFYQTGTSTDKDTFTDVNQTTQNPQPVVLTADGRVPNIFYDGTARVILTQSGGDPLDPGQQIWDVDNVGLITGDATFEAWSAGTEYSEGAIIVASDGYYYRSLVNNNINNDPTVSPTAWERVAFLEVWNTNVTYGIGDVVQSSGGVLYRSLNANNTGNDPTTDTVNWGDVVGKPLSWKLAASVSPTSVTSFQVTGIPSTAVEIRIVWSELSVTSNNGSNKNRVRVMDDSVVQTTGYQSDGINYQNSATPIRRESGTQLQMNWLAAGLSTTTQYGTGILTKNASTGVWSWMANGHALDVDFEPLYVMGHTPTISGVMNGLEFSNNDGNTYDGGTVSVYYAEE